MSEEKMVLTEENDVALTEEEIKKAKKAKLLAIWDKVTTGILILLMVSPILILAYIFIWFATVI